MPDLFNFIHTQSPQISQVDDIYAFGVKSSDKFRITSSFTIPANTNASAYAILGGTVLLQPQDLSNSGKVNLIIKPSDRADIRLPVKYIIYRGLKTTDFLDGVDITSNKVKTTGSERVQF